jgi:hypothetical protein
MIKINISVNLSEVIEIDPEDLRYQSIEDFMADIDLNDVIGLYEYVEWDIE